MLARFPVTQITRNPRQKVHDLLTHAFLLLEKDAAHHTPSPPAPLRHLRLYQTTNVVSPVRVRGVPFPGDAHGACGEWRGDFAAYL